MGTTKLAKNYYRDQGKKKLVTQSMVITSAEAEK